MKTSKTISVHVPRRYRWLPYLLIAMTLFVVLAGIVLIRFVEHRFVEATGGELKLAAEEVAEKLDRMLFERQADARMMARAISLRISDPKYLSEYLKWMKTTYIPVYLSLAVTDVQGTVVAATESSLVGRDYSRSPSFIAARATRQLSIADVPGLKMEESDVDTIAFTAPIIDAQYTFLGVVILQVGVPFLEEVTTRTIRSLEARPALGGRVEYQMLTRQGRAFIDSDLYHEGTINLNEIGLPSTRLAEAGVPGFIEEEHQRRHVQMVTGYAQTKGFGGFPGLNWSVLVRMDRQDILAPIHAYFWKAGIAGGMIWIPIMGLLLWATTRLRTEHRQARLESAWAKAAEAALLQSQERNRAIVDTALDGVITIDSTGIVTDWNAQATAIFGWSREDALGRALSETIIPVRDRQAHEHGIREFLRTGAGAILNRRIEIVARHRGGREFPVELAVSPAKIGDAYIFSAFVRDITERRRAERRLVCQYAVTRGLSEATTLEEAVPKVLQAVGETLEWDLCVFWRVDKATGTLRCLDLWSAPSVPADPFIQDTWQRVLTRGEGLPGGIWASGKSAWVTGVVMGTNVPDGAQARHVGFHGTFGFPIRIGSEIEGVIEFCSRQVPEPDDELLKMLEDIGLKIGQFGERARTEGVLRETEEQLRQAQRMEAVGRLAGGMAHDFNNLLTVIRGYSELLLGRMGSTDATMKRDTEEIKKAADRAAGLTRQLLAFSRRQFIEAKVINLNALVANMDGMLRRLIGEDIIELSAELDASAGFIKADPGQVEQVIMNLVVNARDAMPRGGRLTIETRNVTIGEEVRLDAVGVAPGSYVLLAVRDHGHGMDTETRSHLFEPFFTTKEKGKGTGLGLSTVYGIVKQSGGSITVESAPGLGATFRIYFPRVEQEEPAMRAVEMMAPTPGRETILLVEDEPAVRGLVQETLRLHGYTVLAARHGIEALLTSAKYVGPIHLLVTDVVMPQISGPEVAEKIHTVRPEIKVLFMSGYPDHPLFDQGSVSRQTGFLQKPFSPYALAQKVREVLDGVKVV